MTFTLAIRVYAVQSTCQMGWRVGTLHPIRCSAESRSDIPWSLLVKRHGMALADVFVFAGYGPIRHYFPSLGRQLTDRAGARHGNLTPPRISPSCPHCLWLWLGRSIIIRLLTRVGPDFHEVRPQCETARHRLFYGRMGTALHLVWPSLMRVFPTQMVLAHPPTSLQPPSRRPPVS